MTFTLDDAARARAAAVLVLQSLGACGLNQAEALTALNIAVASVLSECCADPSAGAEMFRKQTVRLLTPVTTH